MNFVFKTSGIDTKKKCCAQDLNGKFICSIVNDLDENGLCMIHSAAANARYDSEDEPHDSSTQSNKKVKRCKGGYFPGIIPCNENASFEGRCDEHHLAFLKEQKRINEEKIADQKRKEEERKRKEEEKLSEHQKKLDSEKKRLQKIEDDKNKYEDSIKKGEYHLPIENEKGEIIGYDSLTEIDDKLVTELFLDIMTIKICKNKNCVENTCENDKHKFCLIQRDGDNLCIFDAKEGIWHLNRDDIIKNKIMNSFLYMYKVNYDSKNECYVRSQRPVNYSGTMSNVKKLIDCLKTIVPDTSFVQNNIESNIGKLLFKNGIYDFKSNTFVEEFNPEIVFFHKIDRNFPSRNEDIIKWVNHILFENMFEDNKESNIEGLKYKMSDFAKAGIARAIYGDYKARKCYFWRGETASGKGMLTGALMETFPGLVETFTANNFLYSKQTKDEAAKLGWLAQFKTARIMISNEMRIEMNGSKITTFVDSNLLKQVVSGGDILKLRGLFQDEYKFINRSTLFFMGNDFPEYMPKDDAVTDRVCEMNFPKSFVEHPNPNNPYQFKRDVTIKDKFKQDEYKDALFWVLADAYQKLVKDKNFPQIIKDENDEKDEAEETKVTVLSILEEYYDFSSNIEDKVPVTELNTLLRTKLGITDMKIGVEFKKLRSQKFKNSKGEIVTYEFESKVTDKRYRTNLIKKINFNPYE